MKQEHVIWILQKVADWVTDKSINPNLKPLEGSTAVSTIHEENIFEKCFHEILRGI